MKALLWSLPALAAALVAYVTWVRPHLAQRDEFHQFYELADGFWARVRAWIKVRWDMATAAVMILLPELPDLLTELQAVDLTALSPSEAWRTIAKIVGVMIPVARAFLLRRLAGG